MSKKKVIVVEYGGRRLLLDTLGMYWPYEKDDDRKLAWYGIVYMLRSGEKITAGGNDEILRDKVIAFLDEHFTPVKFDADKCKVCTKSSSTCRRDNDCAEWNRFPAFERKE